MGRLDEARTIAERGYEAHQALAEPFEWHPWTHTFFRAEALAHGGRFGEAGELTTGIRYRALSGIPTNALAAHYLYGGAESFLLPRGQLGRTEFDHGLDVHIGYRRNLSKGMALELFADIYNVYNRQGTFDVDDVYAPQFSLAQGGTGGTEQNANPVSGGTYDDLIWVKTIDRDGNQSATPIGRSPNVLRFALL